MEVPNGIRLLVLAVLTSVGICSCVTNNPARSRSTQATPKPVDSLAPVNSFPVVHVFVALADNVNQGIVPVSPSLGNGDNPATNLYWGAAFGMKTFFSKSRDWQLVSSSANPRGGVLERCVFKHRKRDLFLVADAYRGKEISQATWDFLQAAAGRPGDLLKADNVEFNSDGSAELLVYVGHNGLMDFKLHSAPQQRDNRQRRTIILACASKQYFSLPLKSTGAAPLLWTTNLMAPEAYVLSAALDGWINKESGEQVRARAAKAYDQYQHCGLKSGAALFATGW